MPVLYSIVGNLLSMEFVGKYEPDDIIRQFASAMKDPACSNPVALLVDVTRSEILATATVAEIRRVAEFLGPYAARIGGRCAIVAASDVHFGLSRMGSAYSGGVGIEVQVFRTLENATVWLGVTPARDDKE